MSESSPPRTSDLSEWFAAQYSAAVGLGAAEGGRAFKRFVQPFPVAAPAGVPYPMTGRVRMSAFLNLKLRYPLGSEGYTCLAMAASAGPHTAHYAYAYWRRSHEGALPEYICVSPTFDSRDGEYRHRFVRYAAFAQAFEGLATELAPFEEATLAMIASGRLKLKATVYPEDKAELVADRASELRLAVTAFAAALVLDIWETTRGMLAAHTSKAYTLLVGSIAEGYPHLVGLAHELATVARPGATTAFSRGSEDALSVQCGQKLVPMYAREATQAFDYNLATWREMAVTRLVGDLVLNYVSPSFAFYNQWAYVEGADESLFENEAMEERYARGRAVEEAARSLREARRRLGGPGTSQNYRAKELDARVYESLEYAQSYLLMSPVALVHTMEDVGWALRSLAAYVRLAPTQWPAAVGAFADRDSAARHLFEFAYGAHCLHTKVGAAHTDLHGNNMTFYMWGLAHRQVPARTGAIEYEPYHDDPVVAYVAGPRGEADTYVFPAAGDSGCLIDYSRCILGPAFRPHLEEGRPPAYAAHFYRDQVHRVMRTLHRYAPTFVEKNETALKAAALANFEAVFPVLCAVDFIAVGRSVGAALAEAAASAGERDARPYTVAQAGIDLAAKLEKEAHEMFVTGLHDLAEASGQRRQMPSFAFPGAALLERVFGEWTFPRWAAREPRRARTAALVDAYSYQNEVKYSGGDYARWPPWARLDEIERHLGEYRIQDLFERGVEPFLEALRPGARVEVIAERLRAEQEKLDGKPAATASSWLQE